MAKTRDEIKGDVEKVAEALSKFVIEVCEGKRTSGADVQAMPKAAKRYIEIMGFSRNL